ncbi:hypothetical protein N5D48_03745 [Pseudomonas sp. GD03858]|uniref:tetratricopeptide repeat protein n=1 Tax=unclassified Pseudomonas TaxID=196821 RepID=UPI002448C7CB|nr:MULTISPECIES: tetratricopeptide repeat protein [unclassified Pseudomonas]MDH0645888.1 hypothetical protein [Pseudomonas sp. GD03867]MDH0661504.1 hypothetical protein [Pseudomonas sp. GD03858]
MNSPNAKNSAGLITDIRKLISDHPGIVNLLSALGGAVAAIAGAYSFIDNKVNSVAESRLAPYEQLYTGLSLNQGEEFSAAARAFQELVTSKDFNNLPEKSKSLTFDGLLFAVTNADDISDFRGALKKVTKRIDESGEESPWNLNQLGWAFIRLGELTQAKEYFDRSIKHYKIKKELASSSDPVRGLVIVSLLENNPHKAFITAQELKVLRPSLYKDNSDLIAEIQESQNTRFFESFSSLYGTPFKDSIEQYITFLSKTGIFSDQAN